MNTTLFGGRDGPLRKSYELCMRERPYNYLLVDAFADDVNNRLRSNIFEDERPVVIYRDC